MSFRTCFASLGRNNQYSMLFSSTIFDFVTWYFYFWFSQLARGALILVKLRNCFSSWPDKDNLIGKILGLWAVNTNSFTNFLGHNSRHIEVPREFKIEFRVWSTITTMKRVAQVSISIYTSVKNWPYYFLYWYVFSDKKDFKSESRAQTRSGSIFRIPQVPLDAHYEITFQDSSKHIFATFHFLYVCGLRIEYVN